jgi:hypothetical protein
MFDYHRGKPVSPHHRLDLRKRCAVLCGSVSWMPCIAVPSDSKDIGSNMGLWTLGSMELIKRGNGNSPNYMEVE